MSAPHGTLWICAALAAAAALALLLHGPIAQDPGYHAFADTRTLLGVPNFWNVVSNAPFALAGAVGLATCADPRSTGVLPELRLAYGLLYAGTLLVAAGSAWYHLAPSDARLVWDRLPMTVAFMAFFAILVGEQLRPDWGRRCLLPLVVLGMASVAIWMATADLRAYAFVQFVPALLAPLLLLRHRSRLGGVGAIWLVLASYVLAKLLEAGDAGLYARLGFAGHPLKHAVAAAGILVLALAARTRRPLGAPADVR